MEKSGPALTLARGLILAAEVATPRRAATGRASGRARGNEREKLRTPPSRMRIPEQNRSAIHALRHPHHRLPLLQRPHHNRARQLGGNVIRRPRLQLTTHRPPNIDLRSASSTDLNPRSAELAQKLSVAGRFIPRGRRGLGRGGVADRRAGSDGGGGDKGRSNGSGKCDLHKL